MFPPVKTHHLSVFQCISFIKPGLDRWLCSCRLRRLFTVSWLSSVTSCQAALDAFNEIEIFTGPGPNTPTDINKFPMCTTRLA